MKKYGQMPEWVIGATNRKGQWGPAPGNLARVPSSLSSALLAFPNPAPPANTIRLSQRVGHTGLSTHGWYMDCKGLVKLFMIPLVASFSSAQSVTLGSGLSL